MKRYRVSFHASFHSFIQFISLLLLSFNFFSSSFLSLLDLKQKKERRKREVNEERSRFNPQSEKIEFMLRLILGIESNYLLRKERDLRAAADTRIKLNKTNEIECNEMEFNELVCGFHSLFCFGRNLNWCRSSNYRNSFSLSKLEIKLDWKQIASVCLKERFKLAGMKERLPGWDLSSASLKSNAPKEWMQCNQPGNKTNELQWRQSHSNFN